MNIKKNTNQKLIEFVWEKIGYELETVDLIPDSYPCLVALCSTYGDLENGHGRMAKTCMKNCIYREMELNDLTIDVRDRNDEIEAKKQSKYNGSMLLF